MHMETNFQKYRYSAHFANSHVLGYKYSVRSNGKPLAFPCWICASYIKTNQGVSCYDSSDTWTHRKFLHMPLFKYHRVRNETGMTLWGYMLQHFPNSLSPMNTTRPSNYDWSRVWLMLQSGHWTFEQKVYLVFPSTFGASCPRWITWGCRQSMPMLLMLVSQIDGWMSPSQAPMSRFLCTWCRGVIENVMVMGHVYTSGAILPSTCEVTLMVN